MKLLDAVVIGAGPVGSYLAYGLADMGYDVAVLERGDGPGKKACCTGIIGRECASSFPVGENVIHRWVNSATLFSPSGQLLRLWREKKQACIIDRPAFDLAMAERAKGRGARYIFNSPVYDVDIDNSGVTVKVEGQGQCSNYRARVAVVAAGFGSKLTESLGLGKAGDFVMGAQTEVTTTDTSEVEVYFGQGIAPGFFAWLAPTSPDKALVGLLSRRDLGDYLRKLLDSLASRGKIMPTNGNINYGGIPLKPLRKTYGDRLIVVGDAAGQVKPTTGGGIYYGLLCAEIASDVLDSALKSNNLSARRLAAYDRQWRKRLGKELRIGYWARKVYERLSDEQIVRIFGIIKSAGIDKALLEAEDLSFDWHSNVLLRLLGHQSVRKALKLIKNPFQ